MKLIYKAVLWVIGLSCFCVFYHYFDPTHSPIAPKCPFWLLTGYSCPGCGSQRAIHCYLNGEIFEGIRYNYLLLPAVIYVILLTILPTKGRLHQKLTSTTACWIVLAVILIWWLVRNLFGV